MNITLFRNPVLKLNCFRQYNFKFKTLTFLIFRGYASNISSITGAVLNLIFILLMGNIYQRLAYKLTEWGFYI
jgi:hypothetical protein